MASYDVQSKIVFVSLLLIHYLLSSPLFYRGLVFSPCFCHLILFLGLQSYRWRIEQWLLYCITFICHVTITDVRLFIVMLWFGEHWFIMAIALLSSLLPGTQNTTGTNVRGTTMRSGSLVATIDRRLSMLVVLYCAAASFVQFRHG